MSPRTILRPATRPLHFPPEIISLIVLELAASTKASYARNAAIFRVALVDRNWAASALSILYGNLHLEWRLSKIKGFLAAIERDEQLLLRVTSLDATQPSIEDLTREAFEANDLDEDHVEALYGPEWEAYAAALDPALGGAPTPFLDWRNMRAWDDAHDSAYALDGAWAVDADVNGETLGDVAFWSFVARLPRLRHLRIQGFENTPGNINLIKDARPILLLLEKLDIGQNSHIPAFLAHTLAHAATAIRALTISSRNLKQTPLTPALHFPHLCHLSVTDWTRRDNDESISRGAYTVADLILACRNTLESLDFVFHDTYETDMTGGDLVDIASVLAHLPLLRRLSLSPTNRWPASNTRTSPTDIPYPPQFLTALPLTLLEHFGLNEPPSKALLDALPPTIQSLEFDPARLGSFRTAIGTSTSEQQDGAVALIVAAKDHLPLLRGVSLKRAPALNKSWRFTLADKPGEPTQAEMEVMKESEQLGREAAAAAAGFGLRSRPWIQTSPTDVLYDFQE